MDENVLTLLISTCLMFSGTDLETPYDCEFETDLCRWTYWNRPYNDVFGRVITFCGIGGDLKNCYSTDKIFSEEGFVIKTIDNETTALFGTSKDLEGKRYSYMDNDALYYAVKGTEGKSTNILVSDSILASPTDRCLKFRFLLTGPVSFIVSYLTDFNDIYLDIPVASYTEFESQRFTQGAINVPILKEFKIIFRVIFENYNLSTVMIDYVRMVDGMCQNDCANEEFKCGSSECVHTEKVCDGIIDCADGSDEKFCDNPPNNITCSRDDSTDVTMAITSQTCHWNYSLSQVFCMGFSNESQVLCFEYSPSKLRNLDQSSPVFWTSNSSAYDVCFSLNYSDFRLCLKCSSAFGSLSTICSSMQSLEGFPVFHILPSVCSYENSSSETTCYNCLFTISEIVNNCSGFANASHCVSESCSQCLVSFVDLLYRNFSDLYKDVTNNNSECTENESHVLIKCDNCSQNTQQCGTENSLNSIASNSSDNVNLTISLECPKCIFKHTMNGTVCSDCLNVSMLVNCECDKVSHTTCRPFCPRGCNCSGDSYICIRQHCPAFTEKILLHNASCNNLRVEEFENLHTMELRISHSVIDILWIRPTGTSLSLHTIYIEHSELGEFYVYSYPSAKIISLQSIHIKDVTFRNVFLGRSLPENNARSVKQMKFRFQVFSSGNRTYHLASSRILFSPQVLEVTESKLDNIPPIFFWNIFNKAEHMVNLSHNGIPELKELEARILDLSHNNLEFYHHAPRTLEILYLNNNRITSAQTFPAKLVQQDTVKIIDLSYNNISVLGNGDLRSGNLMYLNLSRNRIHTIDVEAFYLTTNLIELDLSYNNILKIEPGTFLHLGSLKKLYLHGNPFRVVDGMFGGLFNLHTLQVSFYTICCATPSSIYDVNCIAPPTEISSCEHLIAVPILNVALWYLALLSAFGNIIVLVYNSYKLKSKTAGAYYVLTINLGCADFLMGVYLFTIAFTNLHYTGRYGLSDYYWRHSVGCTMAGIIGTLSSEASAFTVFLITLDRFIVVKYPFSGMKLKIKSASILCAISWLVGIFVAVIPLFPGTGIEDFYAQSGVCISLPLSVIRKSGWQYSMILFVGVNFFLFLGIFVGQLFIFLEVLAVGRSIDSAKKKERETSLATTLFAIVLTDICCWLPIGTIGMLTFFGIDVQPEVYAWMIVVVLPVNSAINPILYTLMAVLRAKKKMEARKIEEMKKQLTMMKLKYEESGHTKSRKTNVFPSMSTEVTTGDPPTHNGADIKCSYTSTKDMVDIKSNDGVDIKSIDVDIKSSSESAAP